MTKIEEERQVALKAELERACAIYEQVEDEMEGSFGVSCVKVDVDWEDLLADVDFQGKKWYLRDDQGDWEAVAVTKVYDILKSMDITDPAEIAWVIRCFRERDKNTNRIEHDPEKRKQQGRLF